MNIKRQVKITSLVSIALLLGSLTGCSSLFDKHIEYEYVLPDNYPVLKAIGYAPLSAQPGTNQAQKMLMAVKVSKLEAYRELTEQVYGQNISSSMTVKGAIAKNDGLQSQVNGVIRGAKVVKSYAAGDTYVTELELDMKRVHDLYITQAKPRKIKRVTYY
ncbi:flagellar biosynthesis protein FlgP [Pseudoalteromonas sp. JBTF-M23]|uniref:Flagellar biosynthesis protein FlgP n=1 Tax=Pseudoalteromonas caenipelagi TaxID=2726988 RepID=A0A849VBU9_9GAMM|nr:LPP20 family lipoprotein [Pseudoalteromonas caenipelagi]NOU50756.1 flagellar biosynthesis protein FlgP [Pseudoalteromonas caenipelagi]